LGLIILFWFLVRSLVLQGQYSVSTLPMILTDRLRWLSTIPILALILRRWSLSTTSLWYHLLWCSDTFVLPFHFSTMTALKPFTCCSILSYCSTMTFSSRRYLLLVPRTGLSSSDHIRPTDPLHWWHSFIADLFIHLTVTFYETYLCTDTILILLLMTSTWPFTSGVWYISGYIDDTCDWSLFWQSYSFCWGYSTLRTDVDGGIVHCHSIAIPFSSY